MREDKSRNKVIISDSLRKHHTQCGSVGNEGNRGGARPVFRDGCHNQGCVQRIREDKSRNKVIISEGPSVHIIRNVYRLIGPVVEASLAPCIQM